MVTAKDLESSRRAWVDARGTEREPAARAEFVKLIDAAKAEHYSERAAIREYDGGMSRDDAEAAAAKDVEL